MEIQLADGSIVRIDRRSRATFLALPSPDEAFSDHTVLQLSEGALRISAHANEEQEFRIDTPSASIYVLGDGDFRIEVDGQRTQIVSRRGVAELSASGGSVLVRGGMRAEAVAGGYPDEPEPFNTFVADSFDRWVDEREAWYRAEDRKAGNYEETAEVYEELPQQVQPYYRELSVSGDWAYLDDYGYVWSPRGTAVGWRPYRNGHWSYGPRGYFWVSADPWGWAPYHYGRWTWTANRWCWIPGRVFAGAWVAWSWGSAYVGWSPLDYWGRPAYVRSVHYGYYDPHAWTFVSHNHVVHHDYHHYEVADVYAIEQDLRRSAVVTRPPAVSPRELASSETARTRAHAMAKADRGARIRPLGERIDSDGDMRRVEQRLDQRPRPTATHSRTSAGQIRTSATGGAPVTPGRSVGQPSRFRSLERATESAGSAQRDARPSGLVRSHPRDDPATPSRSSTARARTGRTEGGYDPRSGATTGSATRTGSRPSVIRPDPAPGSERFSTPRSLTDSRRPTTTGSRPAAPPSRTESSSADARRRDLYDRMSSPRRTTERATTTPPSTPTSSGSRVGPPSSSRSPRPRTAAPPPTSSGSKAGSRPVPASPGGSKARPTSPSKKSPSGSGSKKPQKKSNGRSG